MAWSHGHRGGTMNFTGRRLGFLAMFALAVPAAESSGQGTGVIRGRVIDSTGRPVLIDALSQRA